MHPHHAPTHFLIASALFEGFEQNSLLTVIKVNSFPATMETTQKSSIASETDTERHTTTTDDERRNNEAKEARKRAKEKARSMNARVFRNQSLSSSTRATASNHTSSSRPQLDTSRSARMRRAFKRNKMTKMNTSCDSISELGPLDFNDSGSLGSISSLSFVGGSSRSLLSTNTPITQGPSLFEASEHKQAGVGLPRKPKRYSDEMNHSLSLEDIALNTVSKMAELPGSQKERPWSEGSPAPSRGLNMPFRMASQRSMPPPDESSSGETDSSTTICLSDASSSIASFGGSTADLSIPERFTAYKAPARFAV